MQMQRDDNICLFFFSSRRRHTRYWRDWSSDVCSSDLDVGPWVLEVALDAAALLNELGRIGEHLHEAVGLLGGLGVGPEPRSEERRVGKECRSRWSPYH